MHPMRPAIVHKLLVVWLLWIAGFAFLGSPGWLLGAPGLVLGLGALGLSLRQALKEDWGAMVGWSAWSLAPLGFLAILALANVHLHEFIGGGTGCDAMAQDCNPQVLPGLAHALSLVLFVMVGIATLRMIAVSRLPDGVRAVSDSGPTHPDAGTRTPGRARVR